MIPLYSSFIKRKDMDTVLGCLVTDSIGPGDYTSKFIKNAKEAFGYEAAIAVRSPAIALQFALVRSGLVRGDKVALSALAPLYHLETIENLGLEPAFIDHDPETCGIMLGEARDKGCKAMILHEALGLLPDAEELGELGMTIIEDMSPALGAYRAGIKAGFLGTFAIYALEQDSPVTTGGGALLFTTVRRESTILRNLAETLTPESVLTDYNAALGIAQLKELQASLERRADLERRFRLEVAKTRHRCFSQQEEGRMGSCSFPVLLETGMKEAIIHAKRNGIEALPAFERSIIGREDFPSNGCPGARALALRCVLFPIHEKVGQKDALAIARVLATLP
jgi:dTDP-4-amino-4,6-dideoxygalactose transaminase